MHTALHSRGVVGHNAANHGSFLRCRVGGKVTAIGLENFVYLRPRDAGLQSYGMCMFVDNSVPFPRFVSHQQN